MHEINIRRVDPTAERDRILSVLAANLPAAAGRERFDWLYLSNPDGPALVWLAENDDGEAVGTSAAHPRRMRVGGEQVYALNLGDFSIDRSQRSLGPALRLLRATLGPVGGGTYAFSYDFPSAAMHAVYRRIGVHALGTRQRWMEPVTMRRLLRSKFGYGLLGAVAGGAGIALRRARRSLHARAAGVKLEVLGGECGAEFDALDARMARGRLVSGVRDAAYLNWRYLRNPVWEHAILCARGAGGLAGYAVLRRANPDTAVLVDLQSEDERILGMLACGALRWAASWQAAVLHVEVLAESPAARMVEALGLIRREANDGPIAFWPPGDARASQLRAASNWWLMGGDRDV